MAEIKRTGRAVWRGDLRGGAGNISSESGALQEERYSFGTRFERAPGTNPEELIAAAHAACYSMAFANELAQQGYRPQSIETEAVCTLEPQDGGFKITQMRLQTRGRVPDIDASTFEQIAEQADGNCPVSNLLRPGLTIEREVTLVK
jgi:osmotically inducible protein OsmC